MKLRPVGKGRNVTAAAWEFETVEPGQPGVAEMVTCEKCGNEEPAMRNGIPPPCSACGAKRGPEKAGEFVPLSASAKRWQEETEEEVEQLSELDISQDQPPGGNELMDAFTIISNLMRRYPQHRDALFAVERAMNTAMREFRAERAADMLGRWSALQRQPVSRQEQPAPGMPASR
jgi:hypothetical protein